MCFASTGTLIPFSCLCPDHIQASLRNPFMSVCLRQYRRYRCLPTPVLWGFESPLKNPFQSACSGLLIGLQESPMNTSPFFLLFVQKQISHLRGTSYLCCACNYLFHCLSFVPPFVPRNEYFSIPNRQCPYSFPIRFFPRNEYWYAPRKSAHLPLPPNPFLRGFVAVET